MKKFLAILTVLFFGISGCSKKVLDEYPQAKKRSEEIIKTINNYCTECKVQQDGDAEFEKNNSELTISYRTSDNKKFSMIFSINGESQELTRMEIPKAYLSENLMSVTLLSMQRKEFGVDWSESQEISDSIVDVLSNGGSIEINKTLITQKNNDITIESCNEKHISDYPGAEEAVHSVVDFMNNKCQDYELEIVEHPSSTDESVFVHCKSEGNTSYLLLLDPNEEGVYTLSAISLTYYSITQANLNLMLCTTYLPELGIDYDDEETSAGVVKVLAAVESEIFSNDSTLISKTVTPSSISIMYFVR